MIILKQRIKSIEYSPDTYNKIALAARTCYKSEDKSNSETDKNLVKGLTLSGHHAMLEFADMTIKVICNRGISHQILRHRIASFAQESTRYCNYSSNKFDNQIRFILPYWCNLPVDLNEKIKNRHFVDSEIFNDFCALGASYKKWIESCQRCEQDYFFSLGYGLKPQDARDLLNHSVKTELNIKANMREWVHIFKLRCSKKAHPQLKSLFEPLLWKMQEEFPEIFISL